MRQYIPDVEKDVTNFRAAYEQARVRAEELAPENQIYVVCETHLLEAGCAMRRATALCCNAGVPKNLFEFAALQMVRNAFGFTMIEMMRFSVEIERAKALRTLSLESTAIDLPEEGNA